MDIAQYVLDCARILFSWPVVALALSIFILLKFRVHIGNFIDRLESGSFGGINFSAGGQGKQPEEAVEPPSLPVPSQDDPTEYVKNNPEEVIREYQNLATLYRYEQTLNLIYGSQMRLLEHLFSKGSGGESYSVLARYYQEHANRAKQFASSIENFFEFLAERRLIEQAGEGPLLGDRITEIGVDFLTYVKSRYPHAYAGRPF